MILRLDYLAHTEPIYKKLRILKILDMFQAHVQEIVREGGQKSEGLFFAFQYFKGGGGPAQKIAEKMIFPTKKVAKYR